MTKPLSKFEQLELKLRQEWRRDILEFRQGFRQEMNDQFRIFTDILRQEIRASEHRLEQKIGLTKTEIISEIADILGTSIIPQLEDHDARISRLEFSKAQ